MHKINIEALTRIVVWMLALVVLNSSQAESPKPFVEGSWTAVVIPDTQYYVSNAGNAPIFTEITEWIVSQKETLNIQMVLHVGDIVNENQALQWERAKRSMQVLDGVVPYVLTVGNHDLGKNGGASNRSTMLNDYFSVSDNPMNKRIYGGSFEEGCLENSWYRFEYGNRNYIIFALEFGPRREIVEWAHSVARRHPDHSMILITHEFIDHESTLFSSNGWSRHTTPQTRNSPHSYGVGKGGNVHSGQALWDRFVSKYPNFDLVISGHYKPFELDGSKPGQVRHVRDLASAYRMDSYAEGQVVHQMLFNAQWAPKGGNGWIRLLEFQPDGRTVQVKTYSPYLERTLADLVKAWRSDPNSQFTIALSQPPSMSDTE